MRSQGRQSFKKKERRSIEQKSHLSMHVGKATPRARVDQPKSINDTIFEIVSALPGKQM